MSSVTATRPRPGARAGSRDWDRWAFAALLALAVVLILAETGGLSFYADEWEFVLDRRGLAAATLLRPHGPHLVVVPVLIYKVLLALFGASSYLPYRLLAAFDLVIVALAVGVACRRRWGPWWGLAPVLLLVTLGPGAVTLLWPFQVGYALAVAAGLASLLLVDLCRRRTDLLACGALLLSLASGSQGIGFVIGVAAMIVLCGDWRRRAWVVVIPAVLYGLWYLHYGSRYSETHLSLVKTSLAYGMDSLSATLAGGTGLSSVDPVTGVLDMTFGVPLAVAAVVAVGLALWRGWRPRALFLGAAVTLAVLWVAASASNYGIFSRPASDPRYLSSNLALLLVCLCAGVPRPPQLARGGVVVAGLVLAVVAATNAAQYGQAHSAMKTADVNGRAELGALLLLRGVVAPTFAPLQADDPAIAGVTAGPFFSAVNAFGTDADTLAQLARQPQPARERADNVLQRGELSLSPASGHLPAPRVAPAILAGSARADGRCRVLGVQPLSILAPPGRYELTSRGAPITVSMARFDSRFDTQMGTIPARSAGIVSVLADRAPQVAWRMRLSGAGGRVCVG